MTDQAPVRVVIVGCGGMSRQWIPSAQGAANIELVGLVDLNRDAALSRAKQFDVPQSMVYDNLAKALADARPDAVFDVTVPAAHHAVTIEALQAGCHVLGEKPMSDSLDKAHRMIDAARAADRLYAVTQTRRPSAGALTTARAVADGVIGSVQEIHCDFFLGPRFGGFRAEMEYPLILDMAIHTFDQARQISGADPVSVYCHSWNPARSWYRGDASAFAVFEMTLANGDPIVYTYRGSWTDEGFPTDWHADWRIVGNDGTLRWDGGEMIGAEVVEDVNDASYFRKVRKVDVPRIEQPLNGHQYLIEQFADCIQAGARFEAGPRPMCPCQDNIKSVAMVLAAVESAQSATPVPVRW